MMENQKDMAQNFGLTKENMLDNSLLVNLAV